MVDANYVMMSFNMCWSTLPLQALTLRRWSGCEDVSLG